MDFERVTVTPMRDTPYVDAKPPEGEEILSILRAVGHERALVDPDLTARLTDLLEAAAIRATALPDGVVVRVTKRAVKDVLRCEADFVASLGLEQAASIFAIRGQLLDYVFGHVVTESPLGVSPTNDGLSAAAAACDDQLLQIWELLTDEERDDVRYVVDRLGAALAQRWPALPVNARFRLQETLRVELAGGRVGLTGRVDIVLGQPTGERVGTTLVDVKAGKRGYGDVDDAWWYALLETIRHRAQPLQVGNYYLADGHLSLQQVTAEILYERTVVTARAVERLVSLALGDKPTITPNDLCQWCPVFEDCGPGRAFAEAQGADLAPRPELDDHAEEGLNDDF